MNQREMTHEELKQAYAKKVRRVHELELEVSELQRGYNDSQKEIVVLKNKIKALINKYEV